jgi:hypothetical protein
VPASECGHAASRHFDLIAAPWIPIARAEALALPDEQALAARDHHPRVGGIAVRRDVGEARDPVPLTATGPEVPHEDGRPAPTHFQT